MSAPLRIDQVLLKASPEPNTGCWLWTESENGRGYGRVCRGGKMQQAHRVFYEFLVGPIPEKHELDHKCRVTFCVNPDHLEPVPHRVNVRRGTTGAAVVKRQTSKTHCPRGHAFEGANLYVRANGARQCRECRRTQRAACTERKRASSLDQEPNDPEIMTRIVQGHVGRGRRGR